MNTIAKQQFLDEPNDFLLIQESLQGNKKSLESLLARHKDFIYNLSLRMFLDPDDAMDATQDILIKVITSLQSFQGKSQFRTWLYRIVVNHFLNSEKRKMEQWIDRSSNISEIKSQAENEDEIPEETIEEVRILCSTAMLMCLNREQRLLYILGEVFEIDHNIGATLFQLTKGNYRLKLYRAKKDLLEFVSGRCGLINPSNSCRCKKKTKVLIQEGKVNSKQLKFNSSFTQSVQNILYQHRIPLSYKIQIDMKNLFQENPYQIKEELDHLLENLVKS
ncbi:MAG: RNA polymerase sigma factor [Leptospiraceae bacterium]|jgi:RNA polymerase sigma factor (sigma-70 family)|nr:RNA polymerase sigma factor [Leptospiraceae bacterium]MCZ8347893.1 RNA polymerase sigma factor [Leptospiraceae bacterium]PJE01111.1 MAG: RNA polymerase subunit sigma-24 [Leptospira sp.]